MTINKKFDLYKTFLRNKPCAVVRKDSPEMNFYRIEMEYKIENQQLFVNAFLDKNEKPGIVGYGATINNYKGKRLAKFNNPFLAKTLYEHGQKYL